MIWHFIDVQKGKEFRMKYFNYDDNAMWFCEMVCQVIKAHKIGEAYFICVFVVCVCVCTELYVALPNKFGAISV